MRSRQVWQGVAHALLNLKEFRYIRGLNPGTGTQWLERCPKYLVLPQVWRQYTPPNPPSPEKKGCDRSTQNLKPSGPRCPEGLAAR